MKLEKKHYIIIGVIVAIVAVWYFFLRNKKSESDFTKAPMLTKLEASVPIPNSGGMCCNGTLSDPDPKTGTQWCKGNVNKCRPIKAAPSKI